MISSSEIPYKTSIGLNRQHSKHFSSSVIDHVEGPSRIDTIVEHLQSTHLWDRCNIIDQHPNIDEGDLKETHSQSYIEMIADLRNRTPEDINQIASQFDSVYLCPETYEAATEAVACARNMAMLIAEGNIPNGFALIRPPGHHASRNAADGFCVFNNVAQAAESAYNFGASRILILDFDVHHGQGIQEIFYDEKRVLYISVHRYEYAKFWPHLDESNFDHIGDCSAMGYNVNIALNEVECSDSDYMSVFWNVIWPIARAYNPQFVLLAAGFDACQGDPLGSMNVSADLYAHLVYHLRALANGKLLLCLEGGYNQHNMAICVERCLRVLLGEAPNPLPKLSSPKQTTILSCLNTISALLPYWQQCFGFYALNATMHSSWQIHYPDASTCVLSERKSDETESVDQCTLYKYADEIIQDELNCVTALAYDHRIELHKEEVDTGHMECPQRTLAIASQLRGSGLLRRCLLLPPRQATLEELELIHERPHIKRMQRTAEISAMERRRDEACFDSIYFCEDSFNASRAAVGSLLECVDAILNKEKEGSRANNAFALVRPPGHHASPSRAAGFCIFNNVAIAAKYAIDKYGLERIMIVDWDVHHGNGIQHTFYDDARVLYISIHRHDDGYFYPANEPKDVEHSGAGTGLGFNVNIPFSYKSMTDNDYYATFDKIVMPIAYEYSPQLVIVASGFDAAYGDKLGGYELSARCYAHLTYRLNALAKGRLIVALEGGYTLNTIRECAQAVVITLLDGHIPRIQQMSFSCIASSRRNVRRTTWDTLRRVCEHQSQYWNCLKGFQVKLSKQLNVTLNMTENNPDPGELLSRARLSDEIESDESAIDDELLNQVDHMLNTQPVTDIQ